MNDQAVLIVNADDFGLTDGICRAILHAGATGLVTSTSVLANGPALGTWDAPLRDSGLGVGAHLVLVGEHPPVLSAPEIPTLVNASGRFPTDWRSLVNRHLRGRVDPDDVRREFDAQVDKLQRSGFVLGHVDTHQHVHLWPGIAQCTIDLATTRGIPAVRVPRSSGWSPTELGVRALAGRLARRAQRAHLRFPHVSAGLDEAGQLDPERLDTTIARLARHRPVSAELVCHPGEHDDPDLATLDWGFRWADELQALTAPSGWAAVESSGFRLGTYADLPDALAGTRA